MGGPTEPVRNPLPLNNRQRKASQGFLSGHVTYGEVMEEMGRPSKPQKISGVVNPVESRAAAMRMGMSDPWTRPKGPTSPFATRTQVSPNVTVVSRDRTAQREQPTVNPATPQTVTPHEDVHPDLLPASNGERHVAKGDGQTPIPFAVGPQAANNIIYGGTHHHYHGGSAGGGGGSNGRRGDSQHGDYHLLHPELDHPLTRSMKAGANLGTAVLNAATSGAEGHQLRQLGVQRRTH